MKYIAPYTIWSVIGQLIVDVRLLYKLHRCMGIYVCACDSVFTSAKEVTFSSASVNLFVCLFVCLLAGLGKNYSANLHKIWWKGGSWTAEEIARFWW